jgi:organic radical activating enzyme
VARNHEFVSLTGGEPLLHADFIRDLLSELGGRHFKFYLETNGTLPDELKKVAAGIEIVSMDIKPPSACGRDLWESHRAFLKTADGKALVKMVIARETLESEVERASALVASVDRKIPFVLQPATEGSPPDMERLRAWQALALQHLFQVWIIPQMHRRWQLS